VSDVAPPRRERFTSLGKGTFRYIEIGDIRKDGTVKAETVPMREAPSRATWSVRTGDVITSTIRPLRRLSALMAPEQDGCIASSGFAVLQPMVVPAEMLLTHLRLPVVCELMDLHTSASLYPAISDRDLLALPFPEIALDTSNAIVSAVRSAHTCAIR
jgi:type I restriction enzyme S subunit